MHKEQSYTYAMIKPLAVDRGDIGSILKMVEENEFRVAGLKKMHLSKKLAEEFYEEHKEKDFFDELTGFMVSGPIVALVLEKKNAVEDWRKLIGSTNPKNADVGTIRKIYAESMRHNAVHGSDSDQSALREIQLIFKEEEIF